MRDDTPEAIDLDLWERVLAGGATSEEIARVRVWIRSVAGDPPEGEALRAAVHALEYAAGTPVIDSSAFARQVMTRARSPRRTRWVAWATGAAAAVVVLGTGIDIASRHVVLRHYVTAPGERLNVRLGDGSVFTLAPASRLDVAGDRAVRLDGEALFEVVHDARHPFTVQAGSTVVTDVGTRFDVRAYAADQRVNAAVAEGSVAVSIDRVGSRALGTLTAGDVISVAPTGEATIQHVGDVAAYMAWQTGRLVFRDATLDEVARTLSRWYAVDIAVADTAVGQRTLTGAYSNLPLDQVLTLVSRASGVTAVKRGRTIRFR